MGRRVLAAAYKAKLGRRPNLDSFFEHGHWWVQDRRTGAQWDAVDTNYGFDFEQVTYGDEENPKALPRNRWINAKVRVTSSGKIQAQIPSGALRTPARKPTRRRRRTR